jgi:hypothetical protein
MRSRGGWTWDMPETVSVIVGPDSLGGLVAFSVSLITVNLLRLIDGGIRCCVHPLILVASVTMTSSTSHTDQRVMIVSVVICS